MKLLITTQVVDAEDPVLGFFVEWIADFASRVESIEVICLREGTHALPANVRVHSLGKERRARSRAAYAFTFLKYVRALHHEYDAVFVHMNPEYVCLAGWYWKLLRKRVVLWYVHKQVDLKLRMATFFADAVASASPESFRLHTRKLRLVGHGIDFGEPCRSREHSGEAVLRLVTLGRIAPAKRIELLLDAVEALGVQGIDTHLDIIGGPGKPEDKGYEKRLKERAAASATLTAHVSFLGARPHDEALALLCGYDLFLHAASGTGSLDKAPLEALARGIPVVSTSEAFRELLTPSGLWAADADGLAACVREWQKRRDALQVRAALAAQVRETYALPALIDRLIAILAGTYASGS